MAWIPVKNRYLGYLNLATAQRIEYDGPEDQRQWFVVDQAGERYAVLDGYVAGKGPVDIEMMLATVVPNNYGGGVHVLSYDRVKKEVRTEVYPIIGWRVFPNGKAEPIVPGRFTLHRNALTMALIETLDGRYLDVDDRSSHSPKLHDSVEKAREWFLNHLHDCGVLVD